ncbi:succinate dehydrogenase cytochrome b subunit [Bdellovibrionota bacterium FG-1]
MIPLHQALRSSVGKKLLMALSGLGLVLFSLIHLLGNLSLYKVNGTTFNFYAHTLMGLGGLLVVAEVGLTALFLLHILMGFTLTGKNRTARPIAYQGLRTKGGASYSNLSSRNMIITGGILFAFLILHIWQFRFGPAEAAGYVTQANGVEVRDLHRLVYETFRNPFFVFVYMGSMALLGTHLRHGFWSAFQSLGAVNARWLPPIRLLGMVLSFILAFGFFLIPLWIYFDIPGALK